MIVIDLNTQGRFEALVLVTLALNYAELDAELC